MKTKISLCFPCYNVSKYLPNVFKMIEDQTFKDFEVIFIDDGSTDDTLSLLNEFKKNTQIKNNITIRHQKNKGLANVRNELIKLSTAEYICFVDPDDEILPTSLENLYGATSDGKYDISIGQTNVISKSGKSFPFVWQSKHKKKITPWEHVQRRVCFAWGSIIRKSLFQGGKFLEKYTYEDIGYIPFVFMKANKLVTTKKLVYKYYRRENTLSTYDSKKVWSLIDIYYQTKHLLGLFETQGWINNDNLKFTIEQVSIQSYFPSAQLLKYYSKNWYLNLMALYPIVLLYREKGYNTPWPSVISKIFPFASIMVYYWWIIYYFKNHKYNFIRKIKFVSLDNIINKKNTICLSGDAPITSEQKKKYRKVIFFTTTNADDNYSSCRGIKPNAISKEELFKDEKIYFIDLRSFEKISDDEIELIKSVNKRIIIFIDKKFESKIGEDLNFVYM